MQTRSRIMRVAAAVLLLLLGPGVPAGAAAGAVDPGFGSSGVVQTDVGLRDGSFGLLVQPDGRSISIGTADSTGIVVRHRTDGSLDPTFGAGGVVRTPSTGSLAAGALQPDGRIVAVGTNATFEDLVLLRYLPTGALDPTFGSGGLVQTDFGSADQGFAVAVQLDGRLVAAGRSGDRVAVARYLANGTLDPTFAGDGTTTTSGPAGGSLEASAVGILSTGGIVVGGRTTPPGTGTHSMLLARYTPSGGLDGAFGAAGMVAPAEKQLASVTSLVVQPADRVVVAGAVDLGAEERAAVARYLPSGWADSSFGSGAATIALPRSSRFEDVMIDGAGRLLAAGTVVHLPLSSTESGHNIVATSRFSADGGLDPTFGCAGSTQTEVAPELGGRGTSIGTGPSGRILVGGTAFEASTLDLPARTDLLLVRLFSDGPIDAGYWITRDDGGVSAFGGAGGCGSYRWYIPRQLVVGQAAHPSGDGYWLVARDGAILPVNAPHLGSTQGIPLSRPIVGMAATPSGNGYWLVASDGGIFAYGDARFFGSTGGIRLNQPVVGMAATPSGNGYWLVASDGGIFAYGDALFSGSTGSIRLNRPIVGMKRTPSGSGYWLAAADGGIFAFNAPFLGSTGGQPFTSAAVAIS